VTPSEAARIVRGVLCRGLTHEQADQIVKAMVSVNVEPGTVVLREGDRGQGLLVLLEGAAEIVKHDEGREDVVISTVEAPSVVGEMSLITERPHSATVRARTACAFQLLTRSQFERLLKSESLAAYKVVATLADVIAGRLIRMDEKFVELARGADDPDAEDLAAFRRRLFSEWQLGGGLRPPADGPQA
jgi:CRP-like cAMP-binding protein